MHLIMVSFLPNRLIGHSPHYQPSFPCHISALAHPRTPRPVAFPQGADAHPQQAEAFLNTRCKPSHSVLTYSTYSTKTTFNPCLLSLHNSIKRKEREVGGGRKWTRGGVWDQNDFLNASLPLAAIKQSTMVISSARGAEKETLLNPNGGT